MLLRRFILMFALLTLSAGGCAERAVSAVPADQADQAQIPNMSFIRSWGDGQSPVLQESIVEGLRAQQARAPVREINVLAISGGGADGAYGAGVLCGWTARGDRPTFSVVTGISTGALIAPFAFLGPAYDKPLRDFYTTVSTKDILRKRRLLGALFSDAAADSTPLSQLLDKAITPQMLREIATEHAKGRRLFIGTTNLDAQRPVIWDMGAIAASNRPDSLVLFRKVMLASASIPAAFPPQYFDVTVHGKRYQEMHADGGVVTQVFHIGQLLDYEKARAALADVPPNLPRRVYVIRNSIAAPQWQEVPPRFAPIAGRAVSTLLKANAAADIYRIHTLCMAQGIDFNLTGIPAEHVSQAKEAFDPVEMRRLFELGSERAKSGRAWQKTP